MNPVQRTETWHHGTTKRLGHPRNYQYRGSQSTSHPCLAQGRPWQPWKPPLDTMSLVGKRWEECGHCPVQAGCAALMQVRRVVKGAKMRVVGGSGLERCHSLTQGEERASEEMAPQNAGPSSQSDCLCYAQPMNRY